MKKIIVSLLILTGVPAIAHVPQLNGAQPALVNLTTLKKLNLPIFSQDEKANVGVTYLTSQTAARLSAYNHNNGKCGGFELLDQEEAANFPKIAKSIQTANQKNQAYSIFSLSHAALDYRHEVESAISLVSENNLREWVTVFSSNKSRYHGLADPNAHVRSLKDVLTGWLEAAKLPYEIELVQHKKTKQNSLRVRLVGKSKPQEIIVLGGHFDSINGSGWNPQGAAPGADDNASGSANLVETLRILLTQSQPERSIDFFWYSAEEVGLVGSAEIAAQYKAQNKDVIAALQLDMTLHPGSGELVIGNVSDFTSQWLRDMLVSMNETYLKVRLVDDQCGYACSDHASWFRHGYPTLMPFEATTETMNNLIHSAQDQINSQSSFKHSAVFSKIAVIFAMELANSDKRQP